MSECLMVEPFVEIRAPLHDWVGLTKDDWANGFLAEASTTESSWRHLVAAGRFRRLSQWDDSASIVLRMQLDGIPYEPLAVPTRWMHALTADDHRTALALWFAEAQWLYEIAQEKVMAYDRAMVTDWLQRVDDLESVLLCVGKGDFVPDTRACLDRLYAQPCRFYEFEDTEHLRRADLP